MKIKRRYVIVMYCMLCGSGYFLYISVIGHPLLIDFSENDFYSKVYCNEKGDTLCFFQELNFDDGNWSVYLFLDKNDTENLHAEIEEWYAFKSSDKIVLDELKTNWKFICMGADMATVSNQILFTKDRRVVFKSGIVLDVNLIGLQSEHFGWAQPVNEQPIVETLAKFEKVYCPIIIW